MQIQQPSCFTRRLTSRPPFWEQAGRVPLAAGVPVDAETLVTQAARLMDEVSFAHVGNSQTVPMPLGDVLSTHSISGMVTVEALGSVGLLASGNPPPEQEIRFSAWLDESNGLPAKITFWGVPPARDPLGVLYLFDVDGPSVGAITPPDPAAFASEETITPQEAIDRSKARFFALNPVSRDLVPPGEVEEGVPLTGQPEAQELASDKSGEDTTSFSSAEPLFVETQPSDTEGWELHVLPTEGYAVKAPAGWEIGEALIDSRVWFRGRSADDAWTWRIRRMEQRGSLLTLGQERMDALREGGQSVGEVGFSTRELPSGPAIILTYTGMGENGDDVTVVEHLVVRAATGERGLAYVLLAEGPGNGTEAIQSHTVTKIFDSFRMLGAQSLDR